jgi:hypothetical protein
MIGLGHTLNLQAGHCLSCSRSPFDARIARLSCPFSLQRSDNDHVHMNMSKESFFRQRTFQSGRNAGRPMLRAKGGATSHAASKRASSSSRSVANASSSSSSESTCWQAAEPLNTSSQHSSSKFDSGHPATLQYSMSNPRKVKFLHITA